MKPKNGRNARTDTNADAKTKVVDRTTEDQNRAATIALLAYDRWQARGCPGGDELRDWLEAEGEVLATGVARLEDGSVVAPTSGMTS